LNTNTVLSLNDFDGFAQKYLVDWENKSTVRSQKRSRLQKEGVPEIIFPFFIKPYLKYSEVQALTNEQLAPFYLQSLCDMLYGVAHFEVNFVTDQCGKLANKDLGLELSDAIKQVAIAIGTDEMYHAFVARELLADIKALTGVIPTPLKPQPVKEAKTALVEGGEDKPTEPARVLPMDYFKGAVTPELVPIAEATLLCILENAVVDDFFELAKESKNNNPVSVYNREHLHDEGRHKVFFQRLLKYIWTNISEEDRVILGKAVAGYFEKYFMEQDFIKIVDFHKKTLEKLGISEDAAQSIATQVANDSSNMPHHAKDHIKNPMRLMAFAGLTQHEPTQELFLKLGLIEELVELA
jgi:hypothetical protein